MIAWKARSELASLILAGSATLTADPRPNRLQGRRGVMRITGCGADD
jgi:hypothetical protein